MAGRVFDYSKAAAYIIDSQIFGIQKANEMHTISPMTGIRWRKRFETDYQLQEAVADLKGRSIAPIEPTLEMAIAKQIKYLHDAVDLEPFDLGAMAAMRENYRVLSEMQLAHKMIDSKLEMLRGARPAPQLEQETVSAVATEIK
jgi:hypothetical protein